MPAQHRQGDTAQAHHPPRQPQAEQQRGVFGDGGCRRRPSHVPAQPITSQISSTMFSRLPTISRITGARTYCTPSSQPSSTSWPAPPEHSANESQENAAPVPAPRHCRRQSAAPVRSADSAAGRSLPGQQRQQQRLHKGARQRLRVLCPQRLRRQPVVLMRRNNSSMNRKLVATAPIATPPCRSGCRGGRSPRCPPARAAVR